jgi:hypothetical protein
MNWILLLESLGLGFSTIYTVFWFIAFWFKIKEEK